MIQRLVLLTLLALTVAVPVGAQSPFPSVAPSPSTSPAAVITFGDGTHLLGRDVPPGTYITDGGDGCYWARLSGFGGTTDDIIANDNATGQVIVTIEPTDVGFLSEGCGTWAPLGPAPSAGPSALPSIAPSVTPGLHGEDLVNVEVRTPGKLPATLDQFMAGWNREVRGLTNSLLLRRRPKIEASDSGVRTFQLTFPVKDFLFEERLDNVGLLGRLQQGKLSTVVIIWTPAPGDPLGDDLNAVSAHTALPRAVDPSLNADERNAIMDALDYPEPEESFDGVEVQTTYNGVVYTLVAQDDGDVVMIARAE